MNNVWKSLETGKPQRISLIHNGKYPNNDILALRKIKAWCLSKGHVCDFNLGYPDISCISVIFPDPKFELQQRTIDKSIILKGGPSFDPKILLPNDIEHTCPDYTDLDHSSGRTSWGCYRQCPFCMTWRMEGTVVQEHSPFEEFVRHDKIVLYDANFLASPKCIEKLETIIDNKWRVSFNQGLDIRLINPKIAKLLRRVKTRDFDFNHNRIYFAWDLMDREDQVIYGIKTLIDNGVKPYRMMFYILVGFNTDLSQDIYRVNKLLKFGIDPYVMVYNNRRDIPEIRHLAKFVNQRMCKSKRETAMEYIQRKMEDSQYSNVGKTRQEKPLTAFGGIFT
ncbi:MAG: radical SAM protein [Sulfuricurvum sp.]